MQSGGVISKYINKVVQNVPMESKGPKTLYGDRIISNAILRWTEEQEKQRWGGTAKRIASEVSSITSADVSVENSLSSTASSILGPSKRRRENLEIPQNLETTTFISTKITETRAGSTDEQWVQDLLAEDDVDNGEWNWLLDNIKSPLP